MTTSSNLTVQNNLYTATLQSLAERCEKVSFRTERVRKPEKVYATYGIPRQEKIVAYQQSLNPFMAIAIHGCVLTDQALYFHPEAMHKSDIPKLKYADLIRYIVTQHDEISGVVLQNQSGQYKLCKDNQIADNDLGVDLFLLLRSVQDAIIKSSPQSKATFENLANWSLKAAKKKMRNQHITSAEKDRVAALTYKEDYCEKAACLLAEVIYREGSKSRYKSYVNNLYGRVPDWITEKLNRVPEEFHNNYLADLGDLKLEFEHEFLLDVFNKIVEEKNFKNQWLLIFAYISARLHENLVLQPALADIKNQFGVDWFKKVAGFYSFHSNTQMLGVFEAVAAGEPILDEWLNWTDSMGFTVLHYALILQKKELTEDLLSRREWCEDSDFLPEGFVRYCHKYATIARMHGDEKTRYITEFCDRQYKELRVSEQQLREDWTAAVEQSRQLSYKLSKQGQEYSDLWDSGAPYREIREAETELEELRAADREAFDQAGDLYDELEKTEQAISERGTYIHKEVKQAAAGIKDSPNVFVKQLYRFYTEPEALHQLLLSTTNQGKLFVYWYDTFCFAIDQQIDCKIPSWCIERQDEDMPSNQAEERTYYGKPFPFSWFSAKAHSDVVILKGEYRELAKKFHPDVSKYSNADEVMKEIVSEYQELLTKNNS